MKEPGHIVVIGTSAGGFSALYSLVAGLKPEINAAYLIVLHLSYRSIGGFLAYSLQRHTQLKCLLAMDDTPLRSGYIYVAVPNHHLLVTTDSVKLGNGPIENRWRPSIDVLFRSAAAHFTNRVIGVVLTGLLNDGSSGMSAIKRSGGTTIVQDPNEAEYPDMPLSVLNTIEVDYCVPVAEIGPIIEKVIAEAEEAMPQERVADADLRAEAEMYERVTTSINVGETWGNHTPYTCPDCGGVLFKHDQDAITKYKCHTGHSFSVRDLVLKQSEELESSLWFAIRSMEQKKDLLASLASKGQKVGNKHLVEDYHTRIEEIEKHINKLKTILVSNLDDLENSENLMANV
jgi:two-component system, chemotaxis family, protein-glutamate methylesterase/glutaminase